MRKKSVKDKKYGIILGIVSVFIFGLFLGNYLNFGTISSIQGYLFNAIGYATASNATDCNATSSNATSPNATNCNATNSNATNSNATSSNIATDPTYNILYLNSFSIGSSSSKIGDRVSVSFSTSGATTIGGSVIFKSTTSGATFTSNINSISSNPYIVIPNSTVATNYVITDVLLSARNSDGSTFTKQFNVNGNNGATKYSFNSSLTIVDNNENASKKIELTSISLGSSTAKIGDKVYVNIKTTGDIKNLKLLFNDSNDKQLSVYVKSLDKNPYFQIPSNATSGTYKLVGAILESSNGSTVYDLNGEEGAKKFDFTSTIEVDGNNVNSVVYNNEDITSEIITKLYNLKSGAEININADSNTIISSELFNVVKGTNKKLVIKYKDNQIIFNGRDITSSKAIDVSLKIGRISDNEDINELVDEGFVVNFADNGVLPGKALVRIKATDEMNRILNNRIFVYFYNSGDNNFCEIANNIRKTREGYYEFNITHNSDYIFVNKELDDSLVVKSDDDVTFKKSNKIYILLIVIGLIVIAGVVGVIIYQKKKSEEKNSSKIKSNSNSIK